MTILQAQQLHFIGSRFDDDMDKSVKMVGVMTGKTPEQVDKMPMRKFNRMCAKLKKHFEIYGHKLHNSTPVRSIRVNGRTHLLHYRVDKLPIDAARYVEVMDYSKDVVSNLHKIMASMCQPIRWSWRKLRYIPYERDHESISYDMEKADFKAAYHAAVFFYTHYQVSMVLIRPYLVRQLMNKGIAKEAA